jgi:hypothetical protein
MYDGDAIHGSISEASNAPIHFPRRHIKQLTAEGRGATDDWARQMLTCKYIMTMTGTWAGHCCTSRQTSHLKRSIRKAIKTCTIFRTKNILISK